MLASGVHSGHAKSPSGNVERISLLMLLLVVGLITSSCGTAAQASGNNKPLALSGSFPGGAVHQSYNAVLAVQGGNSPYRFSVASGVLPPGLILNPSMGSLTGTPSTAGLYSFQVIVTDSPYPGQDTQSYSVQIGTGGGGGGGDCACDPV